MGVGSSLGVQTDVWDGRDAEIRTQYASVKAKCVTVTLRPYIGVTVSYRFRDSVRRLCDLATPQYDSGPGIRVIFPDSYWATHMSNSFTFLYCF